jgi:hypothetical protein
MEQGFLLVEIRIAIQGVDSLISCACVLPSRLILFDLTFSLVPGPLLLLASVAFKLSSLVSLHWGQQMIANFLGVLPILLSPLCALAFILWSKFNQV